MAGWPPRSHFYAVGLRVRSESSSAFRVPDVGNPAVQPAYVCIRAVVGACSMEEKTDFGAEDRAQLCAVTRDSRVLHVFLNPSLVDLSVQIPSRMS